MRARDKNTSSALRIFGYLSFFMALYLGYREYSGVVPMQTACDFLEELDGEILQSRNLYQNNSYIFSLHKKCKDDKSKRAQEIKRHHDANTILAFEEATKNATVASIFGSSSLNVCDPLWGDASRLTYKLAERGIIVVEGGGASIMEAARLGVDIFVLKLGIKMLESIIVLRCEYETATPERKKEIESYMQALYADHELEGSYSVHGAAWLSRMPAFPFFGIGAFRAELYSIYAVLDIMSTFSDILIDIESPKPSEGTLLEVASGNALMTYNPYLSPGRKQYTDHYGPNGYASERCNRTHVKCATTVEQLIDGVDKFVLENLCAENYSVTVCKNAFYQPLVSLGISMKVSDNSLSM